MSSMGCGPFTDTPSQLFIHHVGKILLVKRIIISLEQATRARKTFYWQPFAVEDYLQEDQLHSVSLFHRQVCEDVIYIRLKTKRPARYGGLLFGSPEQLDP